MQHVQVDFNAKFPDDQFAFKFPGHALVTDRTFTKPLVYMLREDRRKRIITSEERKGGIKYLDYLAAIRREATAEQN